MTKAINTSAPTKFRFYPIKINKHDTIYEAFEDNPKGSFLTEQVKIEKFQGYSNAYNLGLYFRIKDASSWTKSKQITGLWATRRKGAFYGDLWDGKVKSLMLFMIDDESKELTVYVYRNGYYPHRNTIESLVSQI
jgi:hypothetical protein